MLKIHGLWFRQIGPARVLLPLLIISLLTLGVALPVLSVAQAVLRDPLPFCDPDRLVKASVRMDEEGHSRNFGGISDSMYLRLGHGSDSFADVALHTYQNAQIEWSGAAEDVQMSRCTASLFSVLGVHPAWGRVFDASEEKPGGGGSAVVSSRFAKRHGMEPGSDFPQFHLGKQLVQVVGVMPPAFFFPDEDVDLWLPMKIEVLPDHGNFWYPTVARLKTGASAASAREELAGLVPGPSFKVQVESWKQAMVAPFRPALLLLTAIVVLLVVLATATVYNLLAVFSLEAAEDSSIRMVLGAGVAQIFARTYLRDVMRMTLSLLPPLGVQLFLLPSLSRLVPIHVFRLERVGLSSYGVIVCLVWVFLLPACSSLMSLKALVRRGPSTTSFTKLTVTAAREGSRRLKGTVLAVEVASSVLLLTLGVAMVQGFLRLSRIDPGIDHPSVMSFRLAPSDPKRSVEPPELSEFLTRLRALPGVASVGASNCLPRTPKGEMSVEGNHAPSDLVCRFSRVDPGYFPTIGARLVAGRLFRADESVRDHVAIVNESLARLLGGSVESALASRIGHPPIEDGARIVGIIQDNHTDGINEPTVPELYLLPKPRDPWTDSFYIVFQADQPNGVVRQATSMAAGPEFRWKVSDVRTLDDRFFETILPQRFWAFVSSSLMMAALCIVIGGIYAVCASVLAERRRDLAVRRALGAGSTRAVRETLAGQLRAALIGLFAGCIAVKLTTPLISTEVAGLADLGWSPLLAASGIVIVIAGFALAGSGLRVLRHSLAREL